MKTQDAKILKVNGQGIQLIRDKHGLWIGKIKDNGPNTVLHVGSDTYIKRVWNARYCYIWTIHQPTGCWMRNEKKDNSLKV